ncbi:hypothetical protein TNCV_3197731 [Trichonephila clavipes]|nr:hypothetical protein TNCV_3197731 [Trichonephila clavipes]
MEVIFQQPYIPICIEGGWYTHQRSQTVARKNTPDYDLSTMSLYTLNLDCRIHGFMRMTLYPQPHVGVKYLESRLITPSDSFPSPLHSSLYALSSSQEVKHSSFTD